MSAWLVWLIAAVAFAGAEALSLDLVLVMIAAAALAGSVSAAAGAPVPAQFAVAAIAGLALLAFVRPLAKRHLLSGPVHRSGSDGLVGRDAVVLAPVDVNGGLVKLNGSEWSARVYDASQVITIGTQVRVVGITGATAVVWQEPPATGATRSW